MVTTDLWLRGTVEETLLDTAATLTNNSLIDPSVSSAGCLDLIELSLDENSLTRALSAFFSLDD